MSNNNTSNSNNNINSGGISAAARANRQSVVPPSSSSQQQEPNPNNNNDDDDNNNSRPCGPPPPLSPPHPQHHDDDDNNDESSSSTRLPLTAQHNQKDLAKTTDCRSSSSSSSMNSSSSATKILSLLLGGPTNQRRRDEVFRMLSMIHHDFIPEAFVHPYYNNKDSDDADIFLPLLLEQGYISKKQRQQAPQQQDIPPTYYTITPELRQHIRRQEQEHQSYTASKDASTCIVEAVLRHIQKCLKSCKQRDAIHYLPHLESLLLNLPPTTLPTSTTIAEVYGDILLRMGLILQRPPKAEYNRAIEIYQLGLKIVVAPNDNKNSSSKTEAEESSSVSSVVERNLYYRLGTCYRLQGNHQESKVYCLKALALYGYDDLESEQQQRRHDHQQPQLLHHNNKKETKNSEWNILSQLFHVVGHCHWKDGMVIEARVSFEHELAVKETMYGGGGGVEQQQQQQPNERIARTLNNLGSVCRDGGDLMAARNYSLQSLQMQQQLNKGDNLETATTLNNLGSLCYSLGQWENAREFLEQSLAMKTNCYKNQATEARAEAETTRNGPCGSSVLNLDIGETYYNLGLLSDHLSHYDKAHDYYEASLNCKYAVFGRDAKNASVATSLSSMALAAMNHGHYKKSEQYFQQALEMQRIFYQGEGNMEQVRTLHGLGMIQYHLGRIKESRKYHKDALEMQQEYEARGMRKSHTKKSHLSDPRTANLSQIMQNLGNLAHNLGEWDNAREFYEQGLKLYSQVCSSGKDEHLQLMLNNLQNLSPTSSHDAARTYYEKALEMKLYVYGEDAANSDLAFTLRSLAMLNDNAGKHGKARECYHKSLKMLHHIYGGKEAINTEIAGVLDGLGAVNFNLGHYKECQKFLGQALTMKEKVYGDASSNNDLATSHVSLGTLSHELGRYPEASRHLNTAYEMQKEVFGDLKGEVNIEIGVTANCLGNLYRDLGETEKSLVFFGKSIQVVGEDNPFRSCVFADLSDFYRELGHFDKATACLDEALKCQTQLYGEDIESAEMATLLKVRGKLYADMGWHEEAQACLDRALQMQHFVLGETHGELADTLAALGDLARFKGEPEKAQAYFEESKVMRQTVYGDDVKTIAMAQTLRSLGEIYADLNNDEKAEICRKEMSKLCTSAPAVLKALDQKMQQKNLEAEIMESPLMGIAQHDPNSGKGAEKSKSVDAGNDDEHTGDIRQNGTREKPKPSLSSDTTNVRRSPGGEETQDSTGSSDISQTPRPASEDERETGVRYSPMQADSEGDQQLQQEETAPFLPTAATSNDEETHAACHNTTLAALSGTAEARDKTKSSDMVDTLPPSTGDRNSLLEAVSQYNEGAQRLQQKDTELHSKDVLASSISPCLPTAPTSNGEDTHSAGQSSRLTALTGTAETKQQTESVQLVETAPAASEVEREAGDRISRVQAASIYNGGDQQLQQEEIELHQKDVLGSSVSPCPPSAPTSNDENTHAAGHDTRLTALLVIGTTNQIEDQRTYPQPCQDSLASPSLHSPNAGDQSSPTSSLSVCEESERNEVKSDQSGISNETQSDPTSGTERKQRRSDEPKTLADSVSLCEINASPSHLPLASAEQSTIKDDGPLYAARAVERPAAASLTAAASAETAGGTPLQDDSTPDNSNDPSITLTKRLSEIDQIELVDNPAKQVGGEVEGDTKQTLVVLSKCNSEEETSGVSVRNETASDHTSSVTSSQQDPELPSINNDESSPERANEGSRDMCGQSVVATSGERPSMDWTDAKLVKRESRRYLERKRSFDDGAAKGNPNKNEAFKRPMDWTDAKLVKRESMRYLEQKKTKEHAALHPESSMSQQAESREEERVKVGKPQDGQKRSFDGAAPEKSGALKRPMDWTDAKLVKRESIRYLEQKKTKEHAAVHPESSMSQQAGSREEESNKRVKVGKPQDGQKRSFDGAAPEKSGALKRPMDWTDAKLVKRESMRYLEEKKTKQHAAVQPEGAMSRQAGESRDEQGINRIKIGNPQDGQKRSFDGAAAKTDTDKSVPLKKPMDWTDAKLVKRESMKYLEQKKTKQHAAVQPEGAMSQQAKGSRNENGNSRLEVGKPEDGKPKLEESGKSKRKVHKAEKLKPKPIAQLKSRPNNQAGEGKKRGKAAGRVNHSKKTLSAPSQEKGSSESNALANSPDGVKSHGKAASKPNLHGKQRPSPQMVANSSEKSSTSRLGSKRATVEEKQRGAKKQDSSCARDHSNSSKKASVEPIELAVSKKGQQGNNLGTLSKTCEKEKKESAKVSMSRTDWAVFGQNNEPSEVHEETCDIPRAKGQAFEARTDPELVDMVKEVGEPKVGEGDTCPQVGQETGLAKKSDVKKQLPSIRNADGEDSRVTGVDKGILEEVEIFDLDNKLREKLEVTSTAETDASSMDDATIIPEDGATVSREHGELFGDSRPSCEESNEEKPGSEKKVFDKAKKRKKSPKSIKRNLKGLSVEDVQEGNSSKRSGDSVAAGSSFNGRNIGRMGEVTDMPPRRRQEVVDSRCGCLPFRWFK